jgi:hypothetical protein
MCVRDIVANLAPVSNVPLPRPPRGTGQKRTRDPEQTTVMNTTAPLAFTEPQEPRTMAGSRRVHAYPSPPLETAPVFAMGGPSIGLPQTAVPAGISLHMDAQGPISFGSTPPGVWAQPPVPLIPHSGQPGERVIDSSGANAFSSVPSETGEQLAWWAYADPAAAATTNYPPDPIGASAADLDAIGAALDALLSGSGHTVTSLPGDDPLADWSRTSMNFECTILYDAPSKD